MKTSVLAVRAIWETVSPLSNQRAPFSSLFVLSFGSPAAIRGKVDR
jgi:hypothetical protein